MRTIIDAVLALELDVLALQEVTADMYAVLRRRINTWSVYRRRHVSEDYFVATAVRVAPGQPEDKRTSYAFPWTQHGRHLLSVRRGRWTLVNAHAESGSRAAQRDHRAAQLQYMSRMQEADAEQNYVLTGDLNLRPGEDLCLLTSGWREAKAARVCPGSELTKEWTWKRGSFQGRYDRVYLWSPGTETARCASMGVLASGVWGQLHHGPRRVGRRVASWRRRGQRGPGAAAGSETAW